MVAESGAGDGPDAAHVAAEGDPATSGVAAQFHASVSSGVAGPYRASLRLPAGAGISRELRRSLHLTDRAVRQWAAHAVERGRPEPRSAYVRLPPLRPELGHDVQNAADAERRKTGPDAERELIAQLVWGIGERLAGIDTDAPPLSTQPSLNQMATEAAGILLAAGRVRGDPGWVVDEANEALRELAALGD